MATAAARAAQDVEALYREHVGAVYRYSYAVLGNHADAEDVTQTTFINAMRALERGEKPRKAENWLLTIAHNIVRQRWRQIQSRPAEVELDKDVSSHAPDDDVPDMADVVRALQRIPPSQRAALVMRELEGRSYQEIGEILGLTTAALETLLFRARRSLAEEMESLVTCEQAELAISRRLDGRLSRKDRRRLDEHLEGCASCARMAKTQQRYRGALKGLTLLPLPISLTFFKGAPSASAAAGLPTIGLGAAGSTIGGSAAAGGAGAVGSGAAAGSGALFGGIAAKVAAVVVTAAAVGGGGYVGLQQLAPDAVRPRAVHQRLTPPVVLRPIEGRRVAKKTAPVAGLAASRRRAQPTTVKRPEAIAPRVTAQAPAKSVDNGSAASPSPPKAVVLDARATGNVPSKAQDIAPRTPDQAASATTTSPAPVASPFTETPVAEAPRPAAEQPSGSSADLPAAPAPASGGDSPAPGDPTVGSNPPQPPVAASPPAEADHPTQPTRREHPARPTHGAHPNHPNHPNHAEQPKSSQGRENPAVPRPTEGDATKPGRGERLTGAGAEHVGQPAGAADAGQASSAPGRARNETKKGDRPAHTPPADSAGPSAETGPVTAAGTDSPTVSEPAAPTRPPNVEPNASARTHRDGRTKADQPLAGAPSSGSVVAPPSATAPPAATPPQPGPGAPTDQAAAAVAPGASSADSTPAQAAVTAPTP